MFGPLPDRCPVLFQAILMLPSIGYGQSYAGIFDYIVLFGCLAYTIVMTVILLIRARRKPIALEKVAK